jgi:hypothetical protein
LDILYQDLPSTNTACLPSMDGERDIVPCR